MERQRFKYLLEHPQASGKSDVPALQLLVEQYPWFGSARMLLAKALVNSDDHQAKEAIQQSAVLSFDRVFLKQFLEETHFLEALAKENEAIEESIAKEDSALSVDSNPTSVKENKEEGRPEPMVPVEVEHVASEVEEKNKQEEVLLEQQEQPSIGFSDLDEEILIGAISATIGKEAEEWDFEEEEDATERDQKIDEQQEQIVLDDTRAKTHSFSSWLQSRANQIAYEAQPEEIKKKKKTDDPLHEAQGKSAIIDQFIKNQPRISRLNKDEVAAPDVRRSIQDDDSFVTETLAEIYARQGHLKKAIKAYERLRLIYPEKSVYFANRIKKLKQEHK